jgi:hypothetical protein
MKSVYSMHRQKIQLLRQLSAPEILSSLPGKALKLYLVLLVSAERIGREETIDVQIMRRALGCDLTRRQLLRIGLALERHGLAILRPSCRTLKSGGRDDTLCFRLLDRGSRGTDGGGQARISRTGRG